MKTIKVFVPVMCLLIAITLPVQADVAPPFQPPGSNLFPQTEGTQVRMVSETVTIDVQANAPSDSLGQAKVTASFSMRNLGQETESMGVLFPLSTNDGFYNYPEVSGFTARVNGKAVSTRRTTNPSDEEELPWAEFDVSFPPGQDVLIEVSYTLEGSGEYPYVSFAYLLHTGAGWQGTIGQADIVVRLPYEANDQNVFIDSGPGWGATTLGSVLQGNEIRWSFSDLEPDYSNDISIALVMPSAWNKLLTEQGNVNKNPQDGEAWGRLGKIAKEISMLRRGSRDDAGGEALFDLSRQAYQKAVSLLPEDALWHAGYADLLYQHYYWIESWTDDKSGLIQSLEELSIAYQLKPNEPFIVNLLDEIRYSLPESLSFQNDGQVTFLWLTATPTYQPSETPIPTNTPTTAPSTYTASPTEVERSPSATETPLPEQTPTAPVAPTETPAGKGLSLPVCSGGLVLPLLFVFWVKMLQHRH